MEMNPFKVSFPNILFTKLKCITLISFTIVFGANCGTGVSKSTSLLSRQSCQDLPVLGSVYLHAGHTVYINSAFKFTLPLKYIIT